MLQEQGYSSEAEVLKKQFMAATNRILGIEHPNTIVAMGNLATIYESLAKYIEAEKLGKQAWWEVKMQMM